MVVEISAMDVVSAELKNRVDNKERNFFLEKKSECARAILFTPRLG
jgi:hypothetical protein